MIISFHEKRPRQSITAGMILTKKNGQIFKPARFKKILLSA